MNSTKQLGLSKEIQQDAQEMLRRAEYALGKAIRAGQKQGEIRRHGQGSRDQLDPGKEKLASPYEFATKTELAGQDGGDGIYALVDDVPEDQFEEALSEARDEGSLSRGNVVRKVQGVKSDKLAPCPPRAKRGAREARDPAERAPSVDPCYNSPCGPLDSPQREGYALDTAEWEPARLIPVSGIKGADEQERRGVSALLAVMESVREFGRALTIPFGAPSGAISTFIEVPFEVAGCHVRPDGLIQVKRAGQAWTSLVEVKTGRNELTAQQLEDYLDVARENNFNAVVTISNQIVTLPGEHPTPVDKKKLKRVALHHLSWSQIHTEAVVERVNRSVADPDQAWILAELIRYLEHPQSGAVDFDDMGQSWVSVRNAVTQRSLRVSDATAADVVARYAQLMAFSGMRLSRKLGVSVQPATSRAEARDAALYVQNGVVRLVETGILRGALRVPNAVAPIEVAADVRSGLITCSVPVNAPAQGKSKTRINWLVRQLANAPDKASIEAWPLWARIPGPSRPLSEVRERPECLIEDPVKELKSFTIRLSAVAGTKRGQGRGSFVGSVLTLVDDFYETVVQPIKPWTPPAPSVRPKPAAESGTDDDGITGELPLKSTQHAAPAAGPEAPKEDSPDDLIELTYTTESVPDQPAPDDVVNT